MMVTIDSNRGGWTKWWMGYISTWKYDEWQISLTKTTVETVFLLRVFPYYFYAVKWGEKGSVIGFELKWPEELGAE